MNQNDYMKRVLQLALKGRGTTSPNPMVGALLVKGNRIMAEGWHARCGADHAEIVVLKKVKDKAKGATLYVNLEPCFHYGRTPPCADQVIASGVKEVVIGIQDPNPLTNGKSIAKLRRAGIKVTVGVLEQECQQLNEVFIKYMTTGLPFVVAKSAQTLDGKIALAKGDSKWITSDETRAFARGLRHDFDAILVGINTVLKDDPCLNLDPKTKKWIKIVVDSKLRISLKARLLEGLSSGECIIATTKQAPQRKIRLLEQRGIHVIICPCRKDGVDLKWLFKKLGEQEITSILIEGGSRIIGSALKAGLVDKMHVYIAPKIIGDQNALSSVTGLKIPRIAKAIFLKELEVQCLNQDIFISGYVLRHC